MQENSEDKQSKNNIKPNEDQVERNNYTKKSRHRPLTQQNGDSSPTSSDDVIVLSSDDETDDDVIVLSSDDETDDDVCEPLRPKKPLVFIQARRSYPAPPVSDSDANSSEDDSEPVKKKSKEKRTPEYLFRKYYSFPPIDTESSESGESESETESEEVATEDQADSEAEKDDND